MWEPGVVFGTHEYLFAGLLWGSAWLDLVGEQHYFREDKLVEEKILYELKRLDVVMLKYAGVPDCPVLVLGFLQPNQEESEWKAIGVLNFHEEGDVVETEAAAMRNICYMGMTELKKEFANTETYILEEVAEMYMATHPTVKVYQKAMGWIETWATGNPRWFPGKSWKTRLTKLYPRQFKALYARGLEPKPCPRCQSMERQMDKATVSWNFFLKKKTANNF